MARTVRTAHLTDTQLADLEGTVLVHRLAAGDHVIAQATGQRHQETPDRVKAQAAMLAAEGQETVTDDDRRRAARDGVVIVRHAGMGGLGVVYDSQLEDVEVLAGWILVEDHRRPFSVGRVDVDAAARRAAGARRG